MSNQQCQSTEGNSTWLDYTDIIRAHMYLRRRLRACQTWHVTCTWWDNGSTTMTHSSAVLQLGRRQDASLHLRHCVADADAKRLQERIRVEVGLVYLSTTQWDTLHTHEQLFQSGSASNPKDYRSTTFSSALIMLDGWQKAIHLDNPAPIIINDSLPVNAVKQKVAPEQKTTRQ